MSKRAIERLLLIGAVAVFLLCAELVAKALVPSPLPWRWPQPIYESSASLGFRLKPLQSSYTADKPVRTNAMGLRGAEVVLTKPANTRRVLVLGDSIAFGYGVLEGDTFSSRLERRLNDHGRRVTYQVINTGVPAFNTAQEVAYFREEGLRFQPDLVVLAMFWNDIADKNHVRVDSMGRLVEADAPEKLPWRTEWMSSAGGYRLRNFLKRSTFLYFVLDRFRQLKSSLSSERSAEFDTQMAVLTNQPDARVARGFQTIDGQLGDLQALCAEREIELLIALLPMPQLLGDSGFPNAEYPGNVKEMCARRGLKCIDLQPRFAAEFSGHTSLFIPYDDHPNERGHEVIAGSLDAAVQDIGW